MVAFDPFDLIWDGVEYFLKKAAQERHVHVGAVQEWKPKAKQEFEEFNGSKPLPDSRTLLYGYMVGCFKRHMDEMEKR